MTKLQVVGAQTVASIGHTVGTVGQLVDDCGHTVNSQIVALSGHTVVTTGH